VTAQPRPETLDGAAAAAMSPESPARVQVYAAAANAAFADKIVRALDREGFELVNGEFARSGAAAVIVVWSGASIASKTLIEAARGPLERGLLIPVSIGRIEAPEAFRHIAPVDLAGWTGEACDPRWRFVTEEIRRASGASPVVAPLSARWAVPAAEIAPADPPAPRRKIPVRLIATGIIVPIALSAAIALRPSPKVVEAPLTLPQADALAGDVIGRAAEPAPMIGAIAPIEEGASPAPNTLDPAQGADGTNERAAPEAASGSKDEIAALIVANTAEAQNLNDPQTEELEQPAAIVRRDVVRAGDVFKDCETCPELTAIPAGKFRLGTPAGEKARRISEGPVVELTIARPFALARAETTAAEWNRCVTAKACPALPQPGGASRPVVNVSFADAQAYARWLSETTGRRYRLPNEAEWEYAARAGAETPFASGAAISAKQASFDASIPYGGDAGPARKGPSRVASYAPNPFGLYDMHGNVWEWTADCWNASHVGARADASPRKGDCRLRVLKGGAWNTGGWRLRAGHRIGKPQGAREYDNGFRVARDIE